MTQFIQLQKFTTSNIAQHSSIIINKDAILMIVDEVVADNLTNVTRSRLYISGQNEVSFFTQANSATLGAALNTVDGTNGINTGSSCAGVTGVIDVFKLEGSLPMVKLNRIINHVATQTQPYICNMNHLLYAEEVIYQDEDTELPGTYLNLVFKGAGGRRIATKLTMTELSQLLNATVIA